MRAAVNTYLRKDLKAYNDETWWDDNFYVKGISDRQTIHANKHRISARYHYNSVESLILEHLYNHRIQKAPRLWGGKAHDTSLFEHMRVLDIGSGSGHWIDFYRSLGATQQIGIEVSASAAKHLQDNYSGECGIKIYHGNALKVLQELDGNFDIINAIGVMFHIMDDTEWSETIIGLAKKTKSNCILIIGGHFGWFDGLNVKDASSGYVHKRLRSMRHWRRVLKKAGFSRIYFYRNNAYLWINDPLPENNILIAEQETK